MKLFQKISDKIDEKKDEFKNKVDPKWLQEVTNQDKCFKDLESWERIYEGKEEEDTKADSKLKKEAKQKTEEKVLKSLGKKTSKKFTALMLETLSMGLFAGEGLLRQRGKLQLALMLDSLNGVALSFRFQKKFKYMSLQEKEQSGVFNSQFNENSKKMSYFRKTGLERFVAGFSQERLEVEASIVERMKAKGLTNQKIQQLTSEAEQDIVATEELLQYRQAIQDEMEQRVKQHIMSAITEKKQEVLTKIQSSDFFQVKQMLLPGKEIDPTKKQLIENLAHSGMDKMIDLIFLMVNTQLDQVFGQVEKYLSILLKILNGIQIASQTVADFNEQRKLMAHMNQEERKEYKVRLLQDQLELAYSQFQVELEQSIQGFFMMLNSMMQKQKEQ